MLVPMRGAIFLLALACRLLSQSGLPEQKFHDAVAAQDSGDYQKAEQLYRDLLKVHAEAVGVRVNLASVLAAEKRFADAVVILLPAEAANQQDLDIKWLLGNVLIQSGRLAEGVRRVDLIAAHGNTDACLLAAETHLRLDEYDEALKQVNAGLKLDPVAPHAYTLRGMILEHTGDFPAAIQDLQTALKSDPKDADAHLYLGAIMLYQRETESARQHLDEAVTLDPASPLALYQLALVKLAQGDSNVAMKDLEEVERRSPQWLQPHVKLAALYYRLNRPLDGARERKLVDHLSVLSKSAPLFIAPAP